MEVILYASLTLRMRGHGGVSEGLVREVCRTGSVGST